MAYDVAAVRSHFPALAEGAAHFDGPGGSQTPVQVADAVRATMLAASANAGAVTLAEHRTTNTVAACRAALADLLGADPRGVVFGRSSTQVTYDLARAIAKTWEPGDEVLVTRLDHDANVRPWLQVAHGRGAIAKFVDFDPETGELPVEAVAAAVTERTRLVATTGASNLIGTRPQVKRIAEVVHAVGAIHWVDGVHATAHATVDVANLGVDVWTCSPYKFLGPHCGVAAVRPELLETLRPDKLLPSSDEIPLRFELGTLPYELMAGTTAAIDFLAWLADTSVTPMPYAVPPPSAGWSPADAAGAATRRERVVAGMAALEKHEEVLLSRMEDGIRALPGVRVYSNAAARTPTLLFTLEGRDSQEVCRALADRRVNAPAGAFYAVECSRHLGLGDAGGIRAGLAPYSDESDVDRLLEALASIR